MDSGGPGPDRDPDLADLEQAERELAAIEADIERLERLTQPEEADPERS